ncbi:MAG: acyltransferase [Pseudobutyrivibrio sp.]|nr:acyltransferase [Pseudobutyrivibrio sp.]
MEQKITSRIASFDLLKFILAVCIVCHHYQQDFGYDYPLINFYGGTFYVGNLVELFFILSGFFMAEQIDKYKQSSFGQFFIRRYFRLFPMAFISTTVCTIVHIIYYTRTGNWLSVEVNLFTYLKGILLVFVGWCFPVEAQLSINSPLWMVCVLLMCYVIYWLLIKLSELAKISDKYLFGVMTFLGISLYYIDCEIPFLGQPSARGYMSFFWGVLLGTIFEENNRWLKERKIQVMTISCFSLVMIIGTSIKNISFVGGYSDSKFIWVYVVYPLIMLFLFFVKFDDKTNNILFLLGSISFEMYVWHYPLISVLRLINDTLIVLPNGDWMMVGFVVALIVVCSVLYCVVERPITAWVNRLIAIS